MSRKSRSKNSFVRNRGAAAGGMPASGATGRRSVSTSAEREALANTFNQGRFAEMEQLARNMTRAYPADAFGWKGLGAALSKMGRTTEALPPMQKSAELNPNDAEAFNNLAAIFHTLGRFAEAAVASRRAIALRPRYAEAHHNLGNAFRSLAKYLDAETSYRQAIAFWPDYAEAHNGLAIVLSKLERLDESAESARRVVTLNPDSAAACNNLAAILRKQGYLDEAEENCRRALMLQPDFAAASNNLGLVLRSQGQLDEAETSFRKAISLNPGLAEVYGNLGTFKKYTSVDDPDISAMEDIYHRSSPKSHDRIAISFALAKAFEDLSQYDEAFRLYLEGNRGRKTELGYDVAQDRALFTAIQSTFVNNKVQPHFDTDHAQTVPRPIFIVGMPRSGTSLVEQILASHPDVFGAGELESMNRAIYVEFNRDGKGYHFNRSEGAIQRIRKYYLTSLAAFDIQEPVITDKMPVNFRWIGFILEAFPDARIVNLNRNPVAVCWSVFRTYFSTNGMGFAWDLDDLAEFYKLYLGHMAFWREKYPGRIYDLNYERLTIDQEGETRKLLDYCGLAWDVQCLDFHETQRGVNTASALQVRKKIYTGSSEAWRRFEKHLQPLVRLLNTLETCTEQSS